MVHTYKLGAQLESNNSNWTNLEQRPVVSTQDQLSGLAKFGLGVGAIGLAGYIPTKNNKRVWDYYVSGIRGAEEYSPAGIFKTFQLSTLFSPFESDVINADKFVPSELFSKNKLQREYVSRLIGGEDAFGRLGSEGVTFKNGSLFWGQTDEVALKYATAIKSSGFNSPNRIGEAYARVLDVPAESVLKDPTYKQLGHYLSKQEPLTGTFNPTIGDSPVTFVGGHTRAQAAYRNAAALGTEFVSRFNRLMAAPFEMEPVRSATEPLLNKLSKWGIRPDIKPSGGLRMLGSMSLKYGLGLSALYMGYQMVDWQMRQSSILEDTVFDEGLTVAAGSIWAKGNILTAKLAEATGLQAYREGQEEIAPGSTSLLKLAGFPLVGAFTAATGMYGYKVGKMAHLQYVERMTAGAARQTVEESLKDWGSQSKTFSKLGGFVAKAAEKEGFLWKALGKVTPYKAGILAGAGLGAALTLPFLPGALIPSKGSEELKRIYSGEQEVAIKKGRWWPMGKSPAEGQGVMYHRPHWLPLMRSRAREKAIWGADEDNISPLGKYYRKEFTYELEEKFQSHPISALPFQDVPIVGPLLAGTLGKFIKPTRLYRTEEWMGEEGVRLPPPEYGRTVATDLGESPGGVPVSPHSPTQLAGDTLYRLQDLTGLAGFASAAIKQKVTGREEFFDQYSRLQSANEIDSFTKKYWDWQINDPLITEAFRRLYPHKRNQIETVNPLKNNAPSWMPGPGGRSADFQHGYLYGKVQFGEVRLPGEGYAALNPEVEGVDPEDYPAIHRYKILADVARHSDEFKQVEREVRRLRNSKEWTDENEKIFQTTKEQIAARRNKMEFQEYQYLGPTGSIFGGQKEESSELLAAINEWKASKEEKPSLFQKFFGGYWEAISHNAQTALEQLTPFSPASKLINTGSAIERYERDILYGRPMAFWNKPIEHFIAPFGRSLANSFGYEGIPDQSKKIRNVNEYFDILKYVKNTRLANEAREDQDFEALKEHEAKKNETLFGINPFTRDYTSLYRSLPNNERDYFSSFENASSQEEREKILEMVPNNEKALYVARWKLLHAEEIKKAKKANVLSDDLLEQADEQLDRFYEEAATEGLPTTKDLFAEFSKTRIKGENYADWYRRTKLLPDEGYYIPGPDWLGWNKDIDLEDVKLKVVETLGEDIHDFGLWPDRQRQIQYKPAITDELVQDLVEPPDITKQELRNRIDSVITRGGSRGDTFITSHQLPSKKDQINITYYRDRRLELEEAMREAM